MPRSFKSYGSVPLCQWAMGVRFQGNEFWSIDIIVLYIDLIKLFDRLEDRKDQLYHVILYQYVMYQRFLSQGGNSEYFMHDKIFLQQTWHAIPKKKLGLGQGPTQAGQSLSCSDFPVRAMSISKKNEMHFCLMIVSGYMCRKIFPDFHRLVFSSRRSRHLWRL